MSSRLKNPLSIRYVALRALKEEPSLFFCLSSSCYPTAKMFIWYFIRNINLFLIKSYLELFFSEGLETKGAFLTQGYECQKGTLSTNKEGILLPEE